MCCVAIIITIDRLFGVNVLPFFLLNLPHLPEISYLLKQAAYFGILQGQAVFGATLMGKKFY